MVSYDVYEHISVEPDGPVATITMRRPEKYNALNTEMMFDLSRAFDELTLDREVDVVVLTGAGDDAFSAGADIEQYAGPAESHDPYQKHRQDLFYEMYTKPLEFPGPVIAKVNGYCVGGGLITAMYCDMRVAADHAQFAVPVTDIGQIPTGGSNYRAVQLVGEAKARELVYTAGYLDADEAKRIGLVNRVVSQEQLDAEVESIVDAILDTGRQAVKQSKRAITEATDAPDLATAREAEADRWWDQFATEERERLVDEFLAD